MRRGGAGKKRDSVEPAIIETLKAAGWSVQQLHIPGGPDLAVGRHGVTELIEVKSGKSKVRDAQTEWHANWRGSPVCVLRTAGEALAWALGTELTR